MGTRAEQAKAVYQEVMDTIDASYAARDFDRFAQVMHIPHHVRTKSETFDIRDVASLRSAFVEYTEYARLHGALTFRRTCLTANFRTRDSIYGSHELAFLNADGEHAAPKSTTHSIIMRMNGTWRVCGSDINITFDTGIAAKVEQSRDKTMPPQPLWQLNSDLSEGKKND